MNIVFSEESKGLAKHLDEDPYIIRLIAAKEEG